MANDSLNHKVSRMYEICLKLWPDEFREKYAGRRQEFNDWLNEKTALNEDHSANRAQAILNWLDELEHLFSKRG